MATNSSETNQGFVPVDIHRFRHATRDITFDLYLKLSEANMAHVFSRTTGLDYKRLAQYIVKGVTQLYIRAEDEPHFQTFISKTAEEIFNDPKTPQEKKIATLLNMTEQNMAELFSQHKVSEATAADTHRVIKNYVELMTASPKTLAVMLKLVSHGEYLYYHSIATAIFSMFIAKASGQFNQRMLEIVGLGGFLHDIGSTQLPKHLLSAKELSKDDWELMRDHPRLGLEMLESTSLPDEVRYIVYQHHEEPGGQGYPNGLFGANIYYPAKIVSLADAFNALISNRAYRPAYSVEEAIEVLRDQPGKYDRDLVQVLASVFLRSSVSPVQKKAA